MSESESRRQKRREEKARSKKAYRFENHKRVNPWMIVGVVVLVVLLLIWLTVADFTGDTDVAAAILPHF